MKVGKMPTLKWLKVDDIQIPENRLHSRFKRIGVFESNVKSEGVIQPIFVFEDDKGNYWLADGQNRLEITKKMGKPLIQAYVLHGSKEDAIAYSVKLNKLRGKVNTGELAEFLLYLQKTFDWNNQTLAEKTGLSKSYVSELLAIAENSQILEKLKKGLISKKEALTSCKSSLANIIPKPETQEKPSESSFAEPVSQETRHEKPTEITTVGQKPLTDEDLGLTSNLKEAMETGKRFKPLSPEDLKPQESKKTEYMTCDYCGRILSRIDAKYLRVHSDEYDKVLLAIKKLAEAERESQKDSSQP
jgi:ParB/RepB/Spo0J family partition protein